MKLEFWLFVSIVLCVVLSIPMETCSFQVIDAPKQ